MRFFVPELHVKLNHPDPEVGDRAEGDIERAGERYERHFKRIRQKLPQSVRRFHDECSLHDADVFAPAVRAGHGRNGRRRELVIVTQNINTLHAEHLNTLITLVYTLAAEPVIETPVGSEPFDQTQPQWLYDEFDLIKPGVCSHSILLGDGRVISIRFRRFQFHIAPLLLPARNGRAVTKAKPKKRAVSA